MICSIMVYSAIIFSMWCRWKCANGEHEFDTFIPDISGNKAESSDDDTQTGEGKRKKRRQETDKGAMYRKYSKEVHEWVTHLRRVHATNPPATIAGRSVKASDPLAPNGPLYYYHSRTALYNDFFFGYWDKCFAPAFSNVCAIVFVDSIKSLDALFNLKFQR